MKTRDELSALAERIATLEDCDEHGNYDADNFKEAVQLLDDLHSEGMRDAAELARASETCSDSGNAYKAILAAITSKPKL